MSAEAAVEEFREAWNCSDDGERFSLLRRCCSPSAEFLNPYDLTHSLTKLARAISEFRKSFPNSAISFGRVDPYHSQFRYSWLTEFKGGREPLGGIDVGELDEEGHICRLESFSGPTPGV